MWIVHCSIFGAVLVSFTVGLPNIPGHLGFSQHLDRHLHHGWATFSHSGSLVVSGSSQNATSSRTRQSTTASTVSSVSLSNYRHIGVQNTASPTASAAQVFAKPAFVSEYSTTFGQNLGTASTLSTSASPSASTGILEFASNPTTHFLVGPHRAASNATTNSTQYPTPVRVHNGVDTHHFHYE
jgi:hypothetical protein